MRHTRHSNWQGFVFITLLLVAWEISAQVLHASQSFGLFATLQALAADGPVLASQIEITLARAGGGFALSFAIMVPLGIFIGRTPAFSRYAEPLIDLFRPLPPLAIVPVAMLFAGTGSAAKISVIFYSASFPILINTIDATRSTHPLLLNVARSIGLSRWEIMQRIDLPAALPQIFSGIRLGLSVALLVSVSSEMLLSTNGVGNYLMRAQEQFRIASGLACLLTIAVVSLVINTVVRNVEFRLLTWHYLRNSMDNTR